MRKAPIWRLLLRFSGPTIVANVVGASYNIVDAIFVGRLGSEALAAVAVVFPLMMIFMAITMGTGVGVASLISRRLGAGEREEANRVAGVSFSLSMMIGGLVALVCLPNLEALLRFFGASGPVLPLAKSYMSILVTFQVVQSFLFIIGNTIRAEGNPMFSSVGHVVASLVNVALDPILIFGLGPIPAMGIAGAATATVIGRSVGGLIFLVYFISGRTSYRFQPSYLLPRLKILIEIYRVGVASIVRQGSVSVVMTLANTTAASFGVVPLAVLGVVHRCVRFVGQVEQGLGQGTLPLIGYNFGAKQKERVGEIVVKSGLAGLTWGLLGWLVFMLFAPQVMSIFNTEPQFLLEGTRALRIFVLLFFGAALQVAITFFFQGIGKGLPSLVVASARQVIFLVPGILILPRLFGLIGLWVAFPVADALSIALTLYWASIEFRRQGIPFRLRYG